MASRREDQWTVFPVSLGSLIDVERRRRSPSIVSPVFDLCDLFDVAVSRAYAFSNSNQREVEEAFKAYLGACNVLLPLLWGTNSADESAQVTTRGGGRNVSLPLSLVVPSRFFGRWSSPSTSPFAAKCKPLVEFVAFAWLRVALRLYVTLPPDSEDAAVAAMVAISALDDLRMMSDAGIDGNSSYCDFSDYDPRRLLTVLLRNAMEEVRGQKGEEESASSTSSSQMRLLSLEQIARLHRDEDVHIDEQELLVRHILTNVASLAIRNDVEQEELEAVELALLQNCCSAFFWEIESQKRCPFLAKLLKAFEEDRVPSEKAFRCGVEMIGPLQILDLTSGKNSGRYHNGNAQLDAFLDVLNREETSAREVLKTSRDDSCSTGARLATDRLRVMTYDGVGREKSVSEVSFVSDGESTAELKAGSVTWQRPPPSVHPFDISGLTDENNDGWWAAAFSAPLVLKEAIEDRSDTDVGANNIPIDDMEGDYGDVEKQQSESADDSWMEGEASRRGRILDYCYASAAGEKSGREVLYQEVPEGVSWRDGSSIAGAVGGGCHGRGSTIGHVWFDEVVLDEEAPFPRETAQQAVDMSPSYEEHDDEEGELSSKHSQQTVKSVAAAEAGRASTSSESVIRSNQKVREWEIASSLVMGQSPSLLSPMLPSNDACETRELLHRLSMEKATLTREKEELDRNNKDNARLICWQRDQLGALQLKLDAGRRRRQRMEAMAVLRREATERAEHDTGTVVEAQWVLSKCQSENQELTQSMKAMIAELQHFKEKCEVLKSETSSWEERWRVAKDEHRVVQEQLAVAKAAIEEQRREAMEAVSRTETTGLALVNEAQERADAATRQLAATDDLRIEQLRALQEKAETAVRDKEREVRDLRSTLLRLQEETEAMRKNDANLRAVLDDSRRREGEATKKFDDAIGQTTIALREAECLRKRVSALEAEAKEATERLEKSSSEAQETQQTLEEEKKKLAQKLSGAKKNAAKLAKEAEAADDREREARRLAQELERRLKASIAGEEEARALADRVSKERQTEKTDLERRLNEQRTKEKDLTEEVEQLRRESTSARSEIAILRRRQGELQERCDESEERAFRASMEVQRLQTDVKALETRAAGHEEAKQLIDRLATRVTAIDEEKRALVADREVLVKNIEEVQKTNERLEAEARRTKEENATRRDEIATLTEHLERVQVDATSDRTQKDHVALELSQALEVTKSALADALEETVKLQESAEEHSRVAKDLHRTTALLEDSRREARKLAKEVLDYRQVTERYERQLSEARANWEENERQLLQRLSTEKYEREEREERRRHAVKEKEKEQETMQAELLETASLLLKSRQAETRLATEIAELRLAADTDEKRLGKNEKELQKLREEGEQDKKKVAEVTEAAQNAENARAVAVMVTSRLDGELTKAREEMAVLEKELASIRMTAEANALEAETLRQALDEARRDRATKSQLEHDPKAAKTDAVGVTHSSYRMSFDLDESLEVETTAGLVEGDDFLPSPRPSSPLSRRALPFRGKLTHVKKTSEQKCKTQAEEERQAVDVVVDRIEEEGGGGGGGGDFPSPPVSPLSVSSSSSSSSSSFCRSRNLNGYSEHHDKVSASVAAAFDGHDDDDCHRREEQLADTGELRQEIQTATSEIRRRKSEASKELQAVTLALSEKRRELERIEAVLLVKRTEQEAELEDVQRRLRVEEETLRSREKEVARLNDLGRILEIALRQRMAEARKEAATTKPARSRQLPSHPDVIVSTQVAKDRKAGQDATTVMSEKEWWNGFRPWHVSSLCGSVNLRRWILFASSSSSSSSSFLSSDRRWDTASASAAALRYDARVHDAFMAVDRVLGRMEEVKELIRLTAAFLQLSAAATSASASASVSFPFSTSATRWQSSFPSRSPLTWSCVVNRPTEVETTMTKALRDNENLRRIAFLAEDARRQLLVPSPKSPERGETRMSRRLMQRALRPPQQTHTLTATCEFLVPNECAVPLHGELVKRCCELVMIVGMIAPVAWKSADYQGINRLVVASVGMPESSAENALAGSVVVQFVHSVLQTYDKAETALWIAKTIGQKRFVNAYRKVAVEVEKKMTGEKNSNGTISSFAPLSDTLRWKLFRRFYETAASTGAGAGAGTGAGAAAVHRLLSWQQQEEDEEEERDDNEEDMEKDGDDDEKEEDEQPLRDYLTLVVNFLPRAEFVSDIARFADRLNGTALAGPAAPSEKAVVLLEKILLCVDRDDDGFLHLLVGNCGHVVAFSPGGGEEDERERVIIEPSLVSLPPSLPRVSSSLLGPRLITSVRAPRLVTSVSRRRERRRWRRRDVCVALMVLSREMLIHGVPHDEVRCDPSSDREHCAAELSLGFIFHA